MLLAEVSKITGGTPVELAFDTVPLPSVEFPASVLAPGGTLATVWPVIDDSHRAAAPGKKVVGVIRSTSRDATMYRLFEKLPTLLESGDVKVRGYWWECRNVSLIFTRDSKA